MTVSVRAENADEVDDVKVLLEREIFNGIPDIFYFAQQRSLFGGFENNDSVTLDIFSNDLDALKQGAIAGMAAVRKHIPGAPVNPRPDPHLASPEIEFIPKDERLSEVGWSRGQLSQVVRTLERRMVK